jgi:hypothetical protein
MTTADSPEHALHHLLSERQGAAPLSTFLDGLSHDERVAAVRGLGRREVAKLYHTVDGFGELGLADLVPAGAPVLQPVRHFGLNSLAMFRIFEKRFYRTASGDEVGGANFQTLSPVTGPGYFSARRDPQRAEVLIDYQRLPSQTPAGWPQLRGNEHGVARLVYGFMIDRLRRVSEHVSVGAASRDGKDLGAYFVLCRQA